MNSTAFTVIIVEYETHAEVENLRRELHEQGNPQIIVIDAKKESLGYGAALNKGMKLAENEYVVCMNSDISLKENALPILVASLQNHSKCGMAGPKILDTKGRIQLTCSQVPHAWQSLFVWSWLRKIWPLAIENWYRLGNFDHNTSRYVPSVSGACFVVRKPEWEALGGADEKLKLYFEEFDLALRYRGVDLKVWFCAESVIIHFGQASTKKLQGISKIFLNSRRYWLQKHYGFAGSLSASWLEFWEQRV